MSHGRFHLHWTDLLDPRSAEDAERKPCHGAVNLPVGELARRVNELPAAGSRLRIVGPCQDADAAVEWLCAHGRIAQVVPWPADSPGNALNSCRYRLWRPHALVEEVSRAAPGAALDLGCGGGRDATFLLAAGWHVTGIDRLPDALQRAQALAARYGPPEAPAVWHCHDLRNPLPEFDCRFDCVLMIRTAAPHVFTRLERLVRPGGSFLAEFVLGAERRGKWRPAPGGEAHLPRMLAAALADWDIRRLREVTYGEKRAVQLWAIRP